MRISYRHLLPVLAVICFVSYLAARIMILFYVIPDIGGIENSVVYFIQRVLDGQTIYTDPESPPYSIAQYPPLYFYLVAFCARIGGITADQVLDVFVANRLISLLLNLLYCYFVCRICVRIFSLPVSTGLLAALLCFIFLENPSFGRPDSLAQALYFAALLPFYNWLQHGSRAQLVLCAFLCIISFFAKQSSFTLPLIIFLWLLIARRYNALGTFTLSCLLFLAFILLACQFTFGLIPLFQNTVLGVNNGFSPSWVWEFIVRYFFAGTGMIFIVLALPAFYHARTDEKPEIRFTGFLLGALFVLTSIYAFKWGSWRSYYTEWWTVVILLTTCFWQRWKIHLAGIAPFLGTLLVVSILITKIIAGGQMNYAHIQALSEPVTPVYTEEKKISDFILSDKDSKLKVFNHVFAPKSFLNNLMFRQALLPQSEIVFYTLYHREIFDYSGFIEALRNGSVHYIVRRNNWQEARFLDKELIHYKLVHKIGAYEVYKFGEAVR